MSKRGNPNWGKLLPAVPAILTEFEVYAMRLGLAEHEYVTSRALRSWCEQNKNRVYIPEWLLKEWGFHVDEIFSGVA